VIGLGRKSIVATKYWTRSTTEHQCDVCPRACKLHEGQRGLCFVRAREGDAIVLTTYGRSAASASTRSRRSRSIISCLGPVLSFGTAGCNLACRFCQNWDISKSREMETLADEAPPARIAAAARALGCKSVAFTYNDPVIFLEYAVDAAIACHEVGVKTVAVTAGYVCPEPRAEFFAHMDAANVDLKAFSEDFYKRVCAGELAPVLDTLRYLHDETKVWLEVTTLLIPGDNDSDAELHAAAAWMREHLGSDVPWHFSAFHPDYRMRDKANTPAGTLARAREIARSYGLNYVYTGNVHDEAGGSTYCPACGERVIGRDWYVIKDWRLDARGCCAHCGSAIAGVFEEKPGTWGSRRMPVRLAEIAA
jgi:pyruvate formate lyase activating enzyme